MRLKEVNKKGNTKHLYKSELEEMCNCKDISSQAVEHFRRKPYGMKGKEEVKDGK